MHCIKWERFESVTFILPRHCPAVLIIYAGRVRKGVSRGRAYTACTTYNAQDAFSAFTAFKLSLLTLLRLLSLLTLLPPLALFTLLSLFSLLKHCVYNGIYAYYNKTISDGGIAVDFSIIKVHTSN